MTAEFFSQVKLDDTEAKGSYGIGLQNRPTIIGQPLGGESRSRSKRHL